MAEETGEAPANRWGEPSEVDRPIFIVGCPRSGTTILRMMLDSHPRISCGPEEPSLFWLSRTDYEGAMLRRRSYGIPEDDWHGIIRNLVEAVQKPYADCQGKTRWALKHPELAQRVPWIDKVYPTSQIIHIVRNPRDVIASSHLKFGRNQTVKYGRRWVACVRGAESAGKKLGPDRFKTIRYEDVVADPPTLMRELISWLGEPWSDDVLHPYARTHENPVEASVEPEVTIYKDSVGKGTRQLSPLPVLYVQVKGKDLVKRFGYNRPSPAA